MRRTDRQKQRKVAAERVEQLFSLARQAFRDDPALANRYIALARRMAMKVKLKLPRRLKKQFCKRCGSYWIPGANVRIRAQRGKMVFYCLVCKHIVRFPYIKEKKKS